MGTYLFGVKKFRSAVTLNHVTFVRAIFGDEIMEQLPDNVSFSTANIRRRVTSLSSYFYCETVIIVAYHTGMK